MSDPVAGLLNAQAPTFIPGQGPQAPAQEAIPSLWTGPDIEENQEIIGVLTDSKTYIERALAVSKNPQETLDKVVVAAWMSQRSGLPFAYTMENYESVSANYWGSLVPPKSARQAIYEAWQASSLRQQIYQIQFKKLIGQGSPEMDEQVAELKRQLPSPDTEKHWWTTEIFKAAADMLPYQWENIKFSVPIGLAAAGAGALMGAAAGPASEFTIPSAAITWGLRGMSLGSRAYTFMSEAGATFDTLLELGVPEDISRIIAIPIGAGKAAIENIQISNIPGLSSLKGQLENVASKELSKELLEKGLVSKIANFLMDQVESPVGKGLIKFGTEYVGKGIIGESTEEVAQEVLDMIAEAAGKAWTKAATGVNIPQATIEESWERVWQTWRQTAMAMVATGLPGSILAGMKTTVGAAKTGKALEGRPRALAGLQGPKTASPPGEAATALPEAAVQTSAKLTEAAPAEPGKTRTATITSMDGTTTQGRIDYIADDRSADILSLSTLPGQEASARDGIIELMRANAGKEIRWSPTDQAGKALRDELVASNPRRVELDHDIADLTETQRMQSAALANAQDNDVRLAIQADLGKLDQEIKRLRTRQTRLGLQWFPEASLSADSTLADVENATDQAPEDPWRVTRQQYAEDAEGRRAVEADRAFAADPLRSRLSRFFPDWQKEEVDVAGALIDLRAKALNMTTQAWTDRYLAPGIFAEGEALDPYILTQAKKAAVTFLEDGRALIHLSRTADFSSWVHEIAHVFRRQLESQDAAAAAAWAGATDGWNEAAEEKWAVGLEEYLRDGTAPSPELTSLFQKFADWLKRIYQAITARVEISPDIRRVYDRLFGDQRPERQEGQPVLYQPGESSETPSSRLTRLLESKPVRITSSEEWKAADPATLRILAREEYRKLEPVVNTDTGKTVHFVQTGFREMKHHSATPAIMKIVPKLRELVEKAILLWVEPDRQKRERIEGWDNFGVRAEIDGQEFYVQIIAWEEKNHGVYIDLFHDVSVTEAEKVKSLIHAADLLPKQGRHEPGSVEGSQSADLLPKQGSAEISSTHDSLLQWIRDVKNGFLKEPARIGTAAFKKWFAGSKAVDTRGRPKVFYHGTYANIGSFSETRDLGYHFGTSEQASTRIGGENAQQGARIIPVYLSIKKPLQLSRDVFSRFDTLPMEQAAAILSQDAGLSEDQAVKLQELGTLVTRLRDELGPTDKKYQIALDDFWYQMKQDLTSKGYDGIVYPNEMEGVGESWVAFRSNQVKSIWNRGTWSTSPHILFQDEPESLYAERRADVDWEKLVTYFGVTDDYREAGFVLPDGRMLDFSGRHWGGYKREGARWITEGEDPYKGRKNVSHTGMDPADDSELAKAGSSWKEVMEGGAIRISSREAAESPYVGIQIRHPLTAEQRDTIIHIVQAAEARGRQISVEVNFNRVVRFAAFDSSAKASKILGAINKIFTGKLSPETREVLFQEGPDSATAAEHEQATKEAVEAGEAVPAEVLEEYKDRDWAPAEITRRNRAVTDARTFLTFHEFVEYEDAMANPDEPVHASDYYSLIWEQAKRSQVTDRQTANQKFLKEMTREHLEMILHEAALRKRIGGLHPIIQAAAKKTMRGSGIGDAHYIRIMDQIRDDPTRYRALFAEITGDEDAIRQLVEEQRLPQQETTEEKLRQENRELRKKAASAESQAKLAGREARREKSYSADLEEEIRKLRVQHEEKIASLKLEAKRKSDIQATIGTVEGRQRIRSLREKYAAQRRGASESRKIRENMNGKIRYLRKIQGRLKYMHPDAKGPLTDLLESVLLKRMSSQRRLKLTEIRQYLQTHEEAELSDTMMQDLANLDRKPVREMTVAEFDSLFNAVRHYEFLNHQIQATRIGSEKMRAEEVLKQSIQELRKAKPLPKDEWSETPAPREPETVSSRGNAKRKARRVWDTLVGMGQDHYSLIIERIAGPDSLIHKIFVRGIEEGRRRQITYKHEVFKAFQAEIEDLGVGNITTWLQEFTPVDRFMLRRGEIMALWMHAQNTDNLSSILHAGFGLKRRDGDHRFFFQNELELQNVLSTLGAQELQFCRAAMNLFEEQGKALGKVFLQKNGYELPLQENYYNKDVMPIGRGSDAAKAAGMEEFGEHFRKVGLSKGMLKERKNVDVPLYINNIAADLAKSVDRAAAYVGFEIPLMHAAKLLYDKSFREELTERFSPRLYQEIEKGLRDIAGEYKAIEGLEKIALQFRQGLSMAFLGFNPWSMLKQPLSLGNALAYVKARYLVQGLAETIGRGKEVFESHKANSPLFTERLETGFTRDIADAARIKAGSRLYGAKTAAQNLGFLGIKSFDAFTVASVMRGAWLQAMDELSSKKLSRDLISALDLKDRSVSNLSVEERNELAYRYADFVSTRTQDQALPEYRSPLSRQKIGKFFTMFGSSSNTALNLLRRSILDAGRNKDGAGIRRLAMTILAVGIMGPAGEAAINMLRNMVRGAFTGEPPDDEERIRTFIGDYIQNVGGLMYFLRDATNRTVNAIQYGSFTTFGDTSNPIGYLEETVQTTITLGIKALTEDDYLQRKRLWTRFIEDFSLLTSLMTQLPLYMPTKAFTRVFGEQPKKKRR